tara:strand:- start:676 stop:1569 length:894 start_codon:yes stop_codon:yes gene_type:complete
MLITPATLQALMTGFKKNFQDGLNTAESQWRDVATEIMSSNRQETYAWLGKTTAFREWVGDRVIQNLASHDYTIKNKSFENTIAVDRDEIEDDSLGIYRELFRQLGQDAAHHPDELVFGLLKDGFTKPCYDGQYFFDSDHPVLDENGDEISVSNMQSGASTPWFLLDTSKPLKPMIFQKRRDYDFVAMNRKDDEAVFTRKEYRYGVDARVNAGFGLWQLAFGSKAALDETNYAAARAAMMSIKGDNGKPLNVRPTMLLVPPSLEAAALKLVQAETNAAGATNVYRNTAKVVVCPWIA